MDRRRFLAAGLACAAAYSYARLVEPSWLDVTVKRVWLKKEMPRPLRVLHLADFHLCENISASFIGESFDLGRQAKPDCICLTGDFINNRFTDLRQYDQLLSALSAQAPCFACLGNHDGGSWAVAHSSYSTPKEMLALLERNGIECLYNRSLVTEVAGVPVEFVGLGDYWTGECEGRQAFKGLQEGTRIPRIVLSHNPDSKHDLRLWDWDLMLAGHTHGGQFIIPFVGAPFAPVFDKRFVSGLVPWRDRLIHITRGVGTHMGFRLNCRPEVSLLDLVPA